MDTKHTPGPWQITDDGLVVFALHHDGDFWGGKPLLVDRMSARIAPCISQGGSLAEAQANARLIAAAPDLLQALQEMADAYVGEKGWENARAIIAKATNTPSPRPEVLPVTSGDDAVPASDQNAATPGDAGGADLCPGCGLPIHDVKSCDAVHCGVWGEP
jgi:hypothetical protein